MSEYEKNICYSLLMGVAVGDALGVPFEFSMPEDLETVSFEKMTGYGTHNQPPGTFSDDSSLTFCLVEALIQRLDAEKTAELFIRWKNEAYWTAGNEVFDIGITTYDALSNFERGMPSHAAAPNDERSNGNGALMRILPLALYFDGRSWQEKFEHTKAIAQITHGHERSHIACLLYLEISNRVIQKKRTGKSLSQEDKIHLFESTVNDVKAFLVEQDFFTTEWPHFELIFRNITTASCPLQNTGYVMHSLQVALHCWMHTNSYEECVIQAIRLGGDTDTNAAIAGGLAGITYDYTSIPERWIKDLLRKDAIFDLAQRWMKTKPI
jgi:ADP-ribosyl-[dinitrogen reductase] hydrolase